MLMAMLNAKSAEDQVGFVMLLLRRSLSVNTTAVSSPPQRISSIAALHRTMLDYYQVMPDSPRQESRNAPYLENSHPHPNTLPPLQPFPPPSSAHSSPRTRREAPESSTSAARPSKRSRTSHSPPSGHRSTASNPSPAPSPRSLHSPSYSSTRSDSADHSPRSQGAMAIDSLLSAHSSREELSSPSTSSKRSAPHMNGVSEYTSAIRGGPSQPSSSSVAAVSG